MNIEDETGMVNVVCSPGLWARYRTVALTSRAMLVHGVLQNESGSLSVVAYRLSPLNMRITSPSRDFR
jgi:error-prone DNA polymerase